MAQVQVSTRQSGSRVFIIVNANMNHPVDCDVSWVSVDSKTGRTSPGSATLVDKSGTYPNEVLGPLLGYGFSDSYKDVYAYCSLSRLEVQRREQQERLNQQRQQAEQQARQEAARRAADQQAQQQNAQQAQQQYSQQGQQTTNNTGAQNQQRSQQKKWGQF